MNIIYTYLITLPILIMGDLLFLGVFAKNLIQKLLYPAVGNIEVSIIPSILFYLLYLVGIFFFAVVPGVSENSLYKTVLYGAVFGFMCYMTYELSNASTIKNWPTILIFIDIFWGTFITAMTSVVAFYIYSFFK